MGYLDNTGLQRFFTGLKNVFAPLSHSHNASDITDYPNDSTKYLRGDGSWTVPPSGSNTTYTFATSSTDGAFDVTPSDTQTAQTVSIGGLGSAAYSDSTDFAANDHTHDLAEPWTYGQAGTGKDGFMSESDKLNLNTLAAKTNATTSASGWMSSTDKTKLDAVGTYYNASGSPSVTNNSNATLCSIQNVPAGVYVVEATCRFASNTSGRRGLRIDTSASSAESATQHTIVTPAASGYVTLNAAAVLSISSTSTIYARVYQNSGSALNTSGYMYAVRIK